MLPCRRRRGKCPSCSAIIEGGKEGGGIHHREFYEIDQEEEERNYGGSGGENIHEAASGSLADFADPSPALRAIDRARHQDTITVRA